MRLGFVIPAFVSEMVSLLNHASTDSSLTKEMQKLQGTSQKRPPGESCEMDLDSDPDSDTDSDGGTESEDTRPSKCVQVAIEQEKCVFHKSCDESNGNLMIRAGRTYFNVFCSSFSI
jgi:hypothetical protein